MRQPLTAGLLMMTLMLLDAGAAEPVAAVQAKPSANSSTVTVTSTATLHRVAIFVQDRPAAVKFYRDVLGYEEATTALGAGPYAEGNPWGLPAGSHIDLTYLKSPDGAYVAILSTDSPLATLQRPAGNANAWNDVTLIHTVTGMDAIYARAVAAGATVIQAPKLSANGQYKQMFLRDPAGIRLEFNEIQAAPK